MIKKYRIGTPFPTESVVKSLETETGVIPYLTVSDGDPVSFTYKLAPDDIVYGLGENVRGINKRGWLYRSKNSDEPQHSEENIISLLLAAKAPSAYLSTMLEF